MNMFWSKKEEPIVLRKPGKIITNSAQIIEDARVDRLVLQHVTKYIEVLSTESQSGFQYCADRLKNTLKSVQDPELKKVLMSQIKMMEHLKERMEFIDAHKLKPWDEMKYRSFIDKYCPETNDYDE